MNITNAANLASREDQFAFDEDCCSILATGASSSPSKLNGRCGDWGEVVCM